MDDELRTKIHDHTNTKCKYRKSIIWSKCGGLPEREGLMGGVTLPRRATETLRIATKYSATLKQSCKNVQTVRTSRCYFFWPVLIFGKSTRKTVLLCPWLISLMP